MKVIIIIALLLFQIDEYPKSRYLINSQKSTIDQKKAIEIATEDVLKVFKSIEEYEIIIKENKTKWFINFDLRNKWLNGGGARYVISKRNGKILKKIYYQ